MLSFRSADNKLYRPIRDNCLSVQVHIHVPPEFRQFVWKGRCSPRTPWWSPSAYLIRYRIVLHNARSPPKITPYDSHPSPSWVPPPGRGSGLGRCCPSLIRINVSVCWRFYSINVLAWTWSGSDNTARSWADEGRIGVDLGPCPHPPPPTGAMRTVLPPPHHTRPSGAVWTVLPLSVRNDVDRAPTPPLPPRPSRAVCPCSRPPSGGCSRTRTPPTHREWVSVTPLSELNSAELRVNSFRVLL